MSTVTSSSDLRLRGQGSKKVKLQNVSNDKSIRVNVLVLDEDVKESTVTPLSDLRIRGQSHRKVQLETVSNAKINIVNVMSLDKHAKVSAVKGSMC